MFSSLLGKITHSSPLFICYIFCLGRCKSETTSSSDSAAELGIDNVGGVFVVLGSGCFMALIIGVLEFLWNVRKVAVDERVSFHLNFSPFLQFFLACPSCASALHLLCFIKLFFLYPCLSLGELFALSHPAICVLFFGQFLQIDYTFFAPALVVDSEKRLTQKSYS